MNEMHTEEVEELTGLHKVVASRFLIAVTFLAAAAGVWAYKTYEAVSSFAGGVLWVVPVLLYVGVTSLLLVVAFRTADQTGETVSPDA